MQEGTIGEGMKWPRTPRFRSSWLCLSMIGRSSSVVAYDVTDKFRPFFEAAEALGLALLIHGGNVAGGDRMGDYHLRNLVGFPVDTTLAAARLIFSGLLDRFPRLRVCIGSSIEFVGKSIDKYYL
jgi:predicted TIM-barrel fold metal-dependent hydrolase